MEPPAILKKAAGHSGQKPSWMNANSVPGASMTMTAFHPQTPSTAEVHK